MSKTNKTEHKKKAMIEALEVSLGVVTTACETVGIGRTQFYQWLKDDVDYKNKVEEIQNIALDYAESKLYEKIGKGDTTAIIFFLKTKGKGRGYIERSEISLNTSGDNLPTWLNES